MSWYFKTVVSIRYCWIIICKNIIIIMKKIMSSLSCNKEKYYYVNNPIFTIIFLLIVIIIIFCLYLLLLVLVARVQTILHKIVKRGNSLNSLSKSFLPFGVLILHSNGKFWWRWKRQSREIESIFITLCAVNKEREISFSLQATTNSESFSYLIWMSLISFS